MEVLGAHLYSPSKCETESRCHIYDPVPCPCCLVQFVAAGFIRVPQQHRSPLRSCQVIHSSGSGGVSQDVPFSSSASAAWQSSGCHHNPIPSKMMSLLVCLIVGIALVDPAE